MTPRNFAALAASRHSVRDFRSEPVPADVLDAILEDARQAPSWSNTRPFMLALATGDRAERLRAAYLERFDEWASAKARGQEPTAPESDFPVWRAYPDDLRVHSVKLGKSLYAVLGIGRGDAAARTAATRRNFEAFGAPVIGLVYVHRGLLPHSAMDAGFMLENLFLSAKAHGVDSCPLGNLAVWRAPGDELFEIPEDYALITGFALGYASDATVNSFVAERRPVVLAPPREER